MYNHIIIPLNNTPVLWQETVMEVPQNDLLWVTNVRRGIVNFFRVAPICDPSSVRPL